MNVEAIDREDELLTTGDVARRAERSSDTVRNWERRGLLEAVKLPSGQRLFRRSVVDRFLAGRHQRMDVR
jgi:DNA-binding transcriptional MerR regulator